MTIIPYCRLCILNLNLYIHVLDFKLGSFSCHGNDHSSGLTLTVVVAMVIPPLQTLFLHNVIVAMVISLSGLTLMKRSMTRANPIGVTSVKNARGWVAIVEEAGSVMLE